MPTLDDVLEVCGKAENLGRGANFPSLVFAAQRIRMALRDGADLQQVIGSEDYEFCVESTTEQA